MKPNHLLIPLLTILVAALGSYFTDNGMKWYRTIKLPSFTPPGKIIAWVWTVIFALTATSALIAWNSGYYSREDLNIFSLLLILNGLMNVSWSLLFFHWHMLGYAAIESGALALSVLALILFAYPASVLASALLVPYFLWVCFATYLNYTVWKLNSADNNE